MTTAGSRLGIVTLGLSVLSLAIAVPAGALKEKSATATVEPGSVGSATAKCKKGSEAISGGFESPEYANGTGSGSRVEPFESKREGKRKWTTAGYDNEPVAGDLIAYAYCEKKE